MEKIYLKFVFPKDSYLVYSKLLNVFYGILPNYRFLNPELVDKLCSELNEFRWQFDTQVEKQLFFDSKLNSDD